jgi:histidinol phosphatase-like PHP family hydrolase
MAAAAAGLVAAFVGIGDSPEAKGAGHLGEEVAQSALYVIDNPYAVPGDFRKGQFHVHSTRSFDGWRSLSPTDLALAYRAKGYQFVAITDHDLVSYPTEVNGRDFLVLPAYESTSESGHIVGAFVQEVVSPRQTAQERIEAILSAGGIAILAHPGWRVGWAGTDLRTLRGFAGIEIYNGLTSSGDDRTARNLEKWHEVLNVHGRYARIWALAVDDAHAAGEIDKGWIMVKTQELSIAGLRSAIENGRFYASNGPSFGIIGVVDGAITVSSPDAAIVRFVDQDLRVVLEGPPSLASYRPTGKERWIRVEAVAQDGRTAWSQPFWILD